MVNYSLVAIVLLLVGGCAAAETMKLSAGTSNDTVYFEAVRNPFTGGNRLGVFGVVIEHPRDGSTIYVTYDLVNYSVTGGAAPLNCSYRLNGGDYTEFPSCADGNVTFALGVNVLEVRVWDTNGAEAVDIVRFNVRGFGGGRMDWWLFAAVAVLLVWVHVGGRTPIT